MNSKSTVKIVLKSEWSNVGHSSNLLLGDKRHQSFFSNTRQDLFKMNRTSQYFGTDTQNCIIRS